MATIHQGVAMSRKILGRCLTAVLPTLAGLSGEVNAATPNDMLSAYGSVSGTVSSPARGQSFFTSRHGKDWSCSSCHGAVPTQTGKHAVTGKSIGALAPTFNGERFTDAAKTEKWFRRNCNDVLGRECSAAEKADVLSWLLTLKP